MSSIDNVSQGSLIEKIRKDFSGACQEKEHSYDTPKGKLRIVVYKRVNKQPVVYAIKDSLGLFSVQQGKKVISYFEMQGVFSDQMDNETKKKVEAFVRSYNLYHATERVTFEPPIEGKTVHIIDQYGSFFTPKED